MQMLSQHSKGQAESLLKLRVSASADNQASRCDILAQEVPLRVVRTYSYGERARLIHLHNISGGILSGDLLRTTIEVGDHASAVITTTSATRIYKARADDPCAESHMAIHLGQGARAEYLPDLTIPYNHSRFTQRNVWRVAANASLLTWDIIAPGRVGYEVDFAYSSFTSDLSIYVDEVPLVHERFTLQPTPRSMSKPGLLAQHNHMGTFVFYDGSMEYPQWLILEAELHVFLSSQFDSEAKEGLSIGVSALARKGLIIKVMDCQAQRILLAFRAARDWLTTRVWGRCDPLPRKIY